MSRYMSAEATDDSPRASSRSTCSDERFHTPRAQASSNRSISSFATPRSSRDEMTSARSFFGSSSSESEFATPRSASWGGGGNCTDFPSYHAGQQTRRERVRDLRRFEESNLGGAHALTSEYHTRQRLPPAYSTQQENAKHVSLENGYTTFSGKNVESGRISQYPTDRSKEQFEPIDQQDTHDIFSLARHNKVKDVEDLLIRGVPVNVADENGNTILLTGCQNGSKRIAKLALRYGANINACNNRGNTALHFSFKYGFGKTLGAYLISKGADANIRNKDGFTCMEISM